jgi:hypothetical protein
MHIERGAAEGGAAPPMREHPISTEPPGPTRARTVGYTPHQTPPARHPPSVATRGQAIDGAFDRSLRQRMPAEQHAHLDAAQPRSSISRPLATPFAEPQPCRNPSTFEEDASIDGSDPHTRQVVGTSCRCARPARRPPNPDPPIRIPSGPRPLPTRSAHVDGGTRPLCCA